MSTEARRPTLRDVADATGVAPATVSKALTGRLDVSEETRKRVREAVDRLGYKGPQRRAEQMRPVVEVLVGDLVSAYTTEVIRGIFRATHQAHADLVLRSVVGESEQADLNSVPVKSLPGAARIGQIVVATSLDPELLGADGTEHLPVVAIDPVNFNNPLVVSVGATHFHGGTTAAEHLIQLGHRQLGVIGGPDSVMGSTARIQGFKSAVERAGFKLPPEAIVTAPFTHEGGVQAAQKMLSRYERPTALFACSDTQAMGALQAARQHGLSVPEDLSVIAYDGTVLTEWSTPTLTSVRQPLEDLGVIAVRTLLSLAAGETLDSSHVELATRLVVRESTGPAPHSH